MKLNSLLLTPWQIEYEKDGVWQKAAEAAAIGNSLDAPFSTPVVAHKFRLTIGVPRPTNNRGIPAVLNWQISRAANSHPMMNHKQMKALTFAVVLA